MTRPPVTYPATLADVCQIADAACEIDGLKDFVKDKPDEHARLTAFVARLHETAERLAGLDTTLIYGPADPSQEQPA